jgi:hypothetical protein
VQADVVKAADNKHLDRPSDARPEARRSIDLAALWMKLVIAWAIVFPMVKALMTPDQQAIFNSYIATIAIALAVVWRCNDTHRH